MTEETTSGTPNLPEQKRWLGIYDNLDFNEYKAISAINNSGLKTFHEAPARYITEKYHPHADTRATKVGHAMHCLVYEPDKFSKLYIKAKYDAFQSNEAKAWKSAAEGEGLFILRRSNTSEDPFYNPPEWDLVHRMAEAVHNHPLASILVQGYFERSCFWIDRKINDIYPGTGKLCKMRMDGYNPDHEIISDLKTTIDASFSGFQRAANDFGYFRQVPWYMTGATSQEVNLPVKHFVFIVVEKEPPYLVELYEIEKEWVRQGQEVIRRDIENIALCHRHNIWPGYGKLVREDDAGNPVIINEGKRDLVMPAYAKFHRIY